MQTSIPQKSLPLNCVNRLAGNPGIEPLYSVKLRAKTGETLLAVDPKFTRALIALMDMNAVLGGAASHYGGPAAFAELMSALHSLIFNEAFKQSLPWHQLFNLINDAGHCENGLYALKACYGFAGLNLQALKGFRSIKSCLTGHGEAHLFPEGVMISNGPLGSALPQAQGLAMADAHSGKMRVTITAISDGACMEGEAREALAAIPGLAAQNKMAPFVLILSDNNTKLSGRIDQECFSMQPTFQSLATQGWKVLPLEDGHDLQKCLQVIEQAIEETRANPQVPVLIHAKTIKGIGTRKTAESASGGHGFPLKSPSELNDFLKEILDLAPTQVLPAEFEIWIQELVALEAELKAKAIKPLVAEEKIQNGISAAMIRARKAGLPVISITSDLPGSTGVAGFRKEYPGDSIDVGIAESNMVSVAAGFSKAGYIPVVDTFAQFGVTKGALPLTMAMLSEAPMIAVYSHTGFQDAADGASHQGLTYLAMAGSIPHVDCYLLTCSEEAEVLMTQVFEKFASERQAGRVPNSAIFFLGRENFPKQFLVDAKYSLGKGQLVYESPGPFEQKITLVGSGSMLPQALQAAKSLEARKFGAIVVNPSYVNQVDFELFKYCLEKSQGRMVLVEDHQSLGGINQIIISQLALAGVPLKVRSLAVAGEFGQSAYNAIELYQKHSLHAEAMVKAAMELC